MTHFVVAQVASVLAFAPNPILFQLRHEPADGRVVFRVDAEKWADARLGLEMHAKRACDGEYAGGDTVMCDRDGFPTEMATCPRCCVLWDLKEDRAHATEAA